MTQACGENFGLPRVVLINLDDVLKQQQSVLTDVVQPAEKRADECCAGFRRQDCLRRRETECDVHLDSFVGQLARRFQTVACQRTFDHDIRRDLRVFQSFTDHAVFVLAGNFRRDWSLNDFADRGDVLLEVDVAFL